MKINAPVDYNVDHFRFRRSVTEFPVIEAHEPADELGWLVAAISVAVAVLVAVMP